MSDVHKHARICQRVALATARRPNTAQPLIPPARSRVIGTRRRLARPSPLTLTALADPKCMRYRPRHKSVRTILDLYGHLLDGDDEAFMARLSEMTINTSIIAECLKTAVTAETAGICDNLFEVLYLLAVRGRHYRITSEWVMSRW
jgi:hypothetical protein